MNRKKILYRQLYLEFGIVDYEIFMHSHFDRHFSDQVSGSITLVIVFSFESTEIPHIHTKLYCSHLISFLRDWLASLCLQQFS